MLLINLSGTADRSFYTVLINFLSNQNDGRNATNKLKHLKQTKCFTTIKTKQVIFLSFLNSFFFIFL